jgi:hypothetical protein
MVFLFLIVATEFLKCLKKKEHLFQCLSVGVQLPDNMSKKLHALQLCAMGIQTKELK